jgi:outer membrane protein OmpU
MKKLLIASTALVATAGMAAADVTITGHAAAGYHSNLVQKSTLLPQINATKASTAT